MYDLRAVLQFVEAVGDQLVARSDAGDPGRLALGRQYLHIVGLYRAVGLLHVDLSPIVVALDGGLGHQVAWISCFTRSRALTN